MSPAGFIDFLLTSSPLSKRVALSLWYTSGAWISIEQKFYLVIHLFIDQILVQYYSFKIPTVICSNT